MDPRNNVTTCPCAGYSHDPGLYLECGWMTGHCLVLAWWHLGTHSKSMCVGALRAESGLNKSVRQQTKNAHCNSLRSAEGSVFVFLGSHHWVWELVSYCLIPWWDGHISFNECFILVPVSFLEQFKISQGLVEGCRWRQDLHLLS